MGWVVLSDRCMLDVESENVTNGVFSSEDGPSSRQLGGFLGQLAVCVTADVLCHFPPNLLGSLVVMSWWF